MGSGLGRFHKYLRSIKDFLSAAQVQEWLADIGATPRLHPKSKQDPWSLELHSQRHKVTPLVSQ